MKVNKGFAAAWESKARDRLDKATEAAKAKAASPQGADEVDQDISSAGSLDALEAKLVEAKTAIRTQQIAAAAAISAVASAKVCLIVNPEMTTLPPEHNNGPCLEGQNVECPMGT